MAVALCASPGVFAVYYDSPYLNPDLPITAWGFAGLAVSVALGLIAAKLARWPRLGSTAVGLLTAVAPGMYIGLKASSLVSPNAAAAAMTIGTLASLIVGGAVGLGVEIMARRERRRTPRLGYAGLGLALGASTGLYLSGIAFMPTVANAKLINLLVGGAIGLAIGLTAARGGHNRPWLGRAGLGLAAGCCTGIWAYQVVFSFDGMFGPWSEWTFWLALGGAAGLAWAGRSGVGRLRAVAAGLAVGAYAGASFGLYSCLPTGCYQESSGISKWSVLGSLAGAAMGALSYRTRLNSAVLGLAIGALAGDTAFTFNTGTYYQGSLDASELSWHVIAGVFGLVVGWLAGDKDKRDRLAAFGPGFGGWVGAWAGTIAGHYAIIPGGAELGGIAGMLVGGLIGLIRTGRLRLGPTALSVAAGAFVGARFSDPSGLSPLRGAGGMIIGGCVGLVLCRRGERAFDASMPGVAVGVGIGSWAGAAVLDFPVPASPTATSLLCMTAGGLVGLMYVHARRFIGLRPVLVPEQTRPVIPAPWHRRPDVLTSLSRKMVSLAAAYIAPGTQTLQERYAEEFDSTLMMITGPLAPLRRLWCAISILIGSLTQRIDEEDKNNEENDHEDNAERRQ